MVIVPQGTGIEIEAALQNKDVGFVHKGQPVEIKVETFTFTRSGLLHGTVSGVSQDVLAPDDVSSDRQDPRKRADDTTSDEDARQARQPAFMATAEITVRRPVLISAVTAMPGSSRVKPFSVLMPVAASATCALVGRNLRRLRVSKGVSQEELGLSAGCEPSYVGRVERGGENPSVDLLEALAKALKADIADLFQPVPVGSKMPSGLAPGRKPARAPRKTAGSNG